MSEALCALDNHRPDWGQSVLPLGQLCGHRLAHDIIAPYNHPASSVSVMDGYAFKGGGADISLKLIGESRAGEPFEGELGEGQAVRIFTGALLPKGADTVEMQENAVVSGDRVSFSSLSLHRNFVRSAGSDFSKGALLFKQGARVTPAMILTLATCNFETAAVQRLPSVALLSSGDELRPVGSRLEAGHIVNSISPALTALLTHWGVEVYDLGIAKDTAADITEKLKDCHADIIVPIGAASVGDYDLMQPAAKALNFKPVFSKVAVKPGKPTWFSKRDQQCILGLPGNPSSAWVCAQLFLKHLIFGPQKWESGKLDSPLAANGKRESFLRAKQLESGALKPLNRQDSGLVTPLSDADCLIRRPVNAKALSVNDYAEFMRLD